MKSKKYLGLALAGLIGAVAFSACSVPEDGAEAEAKDKVAEVKHKSGKEKGKSGDDLNLTPAEDNAVEAATSYLDTMAFSKPGLIDQLEFEGYSPKVSSTVVNAMEKADLVDWNEQAVESATSYLDTQAFSKPGLIDQLEFEGFTSAQAQYGASKAYR